MNTSHRNISARAGIVVAARVALIAIQFPALAYTGQELPPQAKIGIDKARSIVLKAHPGTIVAEELEKEGGGSGLLYSFDIKSGSTSQEVGVDAGKGA
jgi:uncharacterized membrane protein YkoI